jgi:hypothetical protein
MNFIEGLPMSDGFNSILMVVDKLSKYAHFIPLKHPFTTQQVAQVVLDTVIRLHGIPRSIVSDRDMIFISSFWKELFKHYKTTLLTSTTYHLQIDGQTKHVYQCLEMLLGCCVHDEPKRWKT